jgi:hypothetical protein
LRQQLAAAVAVRLEIKTQQTVVRAAALVGLQQRVALELHYFQVKAILVVKGYQTMPLTLLAVAGAAQVQLVELEAVVLPLRVVLGLQIQ